MIVGRPPETEVDGQRTTTIPAAPPNEAVLPEALP